MLVLNAIGVGVGLIAPLLNALSEICDVVTWESRGTLAVDPARPQMPPPRPIDHVHNLEQVCLQLGVTRIDHLLGFCSGGEIAALLASSKVLQPRSVTFAASSQRLPNARRTAYQAAILPICETIVRRGAASHEAVYAALAGSLRGADPLEVELNRINLEPFAEPRAMLLYAHMIKNLMTNLEPEGMRKVVSRIRLPTLILHARNDELIHYDGAIALHREVEQSELVLYDSGGHFLFHRVPDAIEQVLRFVQEGPVKQGERGPRT